MTIPEICKSYEEKIQSAYQSPVNLQEAEILAGEFLHAQILVSDALKQADLDTRMRKSGLKAIRASVYLNKAFQDGKKLSDMMLEQMVNTDSLAQGEQDGFDRAEAERNDLERYFNIFQNAHVFFRGVSRARFD